MRLNWLKQLRRDGEFHKLPRLLAACHARLFFGLLLALGLQQTAKGSAESSLDMCKFPLEVAAPHLRHSKK